MPDGSDKEKIEFALRIMERSVRRKLQIMAKFQPG